MQCAQQTQSAFLEAFPKDTPDEAVKRIPVLLAASDEKRTLSCFDMDQRIPAIEMLLYLIASFVIIERQSKSGTSPTFCPNFPQISVSVTIDFGDIDAHITVDSGIYKRSESVPYIACAPVPSVHALICGEVGAFLEKNNLEKEAYMIVPTNQTADDCVSGDAAATHLLLLALASHKPSWDIPGIFLSIYSDKKTVRASVIRITNPSPEYYCYLIEECRILTLPHESFHSELSTFILEAVKRYPDIRIAAGSRYADDPELEGFLTACGVSYTHSADSALQNLLVETAKKLQREYSIPSSVAWQDVCPDTFPPLTPPDLKW